MHSGRPCTAPSVVGRGGPGHTRRAVPGRRRQLYVRKRSRGFQLTSQRQGCGRESGVSVHQQSRQTNASARRGPRQRRRRRHHQPGKADPAECSALNKGTLRWGCSANTEFPVAISEIPVIQKPLPVNLTRELPQKWLQQRGFLPRNRSKEPQKRNLLCKIPC